MSRPSLQLKGKGWTTFGLTKLRDWFHHSRHTVTLDTEVDWVRRRCSNFFRIVGPRSFVRIKGVRTKVVLVPLSTPRCLNFWIHLMFLSFRVFQVRFIRIFENFWFLFVFQIFRRFLFIINRYLCMLILLSFKEYTLVPQFFFHRFIISSRLSFYDS